MLKESIFKELIKKGYSKEGSSRVWDISNQSLLFSSPELSRAFLEVRNVPIYKKNIVDREIELIKESKGILNGMIGSGSFNLIDMRCAEGERALAFLKILSNAKFRYCPVSADESLATLAVNGVKKSKLKNVISYSPQKAGFEDFGNVCVMLRNAEFQRNVILLMGSTLATFEINDFLFNLSNAMFKGDILQGIFGEPM